MSNCHCSGPDDSDHGHDHAHDLSHDHTHDHPPPACPSAGPAPAAARDPSQLHFRIPGLDCPTEEALIRRALEPVAGVHGLQFDLAGGTLAVAAAPALGERVLQAIRGAGFGAEPLAVPAPPVDAAARRRTQAGRLAAALAVALAAEGVHALWPDSRVALGAGLALAAAAIALAGTSVFRKGLQALRHGQLNINALMTVAVSGAFVIGQWPEAAMVMALYALAEWIEARAVERARHAISGLLALSPPQVEVRQPDGRWAEVPAAGVAVGALARVRPGGRIALDGRVTAGEGAVDQSPVTGESIPADKRPGDAVYAGTINRAGELEFEVTRPATDTVLARIIHAVEVAQAQRAPTQRFVDRFAAVYTPAVFFVALAVALGGPLLAGWAVTAAVYKALVLLVIACPCALVISTPVTVVSALAAAARGGVLIKGGAILEQARRLKVVALDKTGTLTEGRPRLVAHEVLDATLPADEVLAIARSLAERSDHPVSAAVAAGLAAPLRPVAGFAAQPGRGVQGQVMDRLHVLANHRWVEERGQCSPALEARMRAHESQGRSVTVLAGPEGVLALFAVADQPRASSRPALQQLAAMGVRTVMLSGDNAVTAQAMAAQLGLAEVRANLLPEDKLAAIRELSAAGPVAMVGDGINDGPALSAATLGFGMGGAGSDTAREAADVLLMGDDLRKVPETLHLSRLTAAVLAQNIALALGIKGVFLVLALAGQATMWMAVFADMGASLLVVLNGLRLLRAGPPSSAPEEG